MRHIAFRRRGAAHCADDLSGRYLLARRHVRMRLQIGVGGLVAVVMGQHHSGSQQGILRHGLYRSAAGRQHCGAGVGGDIHPVVGAPIPQRLVIHQLLHGKGRQHLAAQRFHNEPRRFCRGRGGIGRRGVPEAASCTAGSGFRVSTGCSTVFPAFPPAGKPGSAA